MGVSPFAGIISPAYCVYKFNSLANLWYYYHLLRLSLYKSRIKACSTGIVESRLCFYTDDLFRLEESKPLDKNEPELADFVSYDQSEAVMGEPLPCGERCTYEKRSLHAVIDNPEGKKYAGVYTDWKLHDLNTAIARSRIK